MLIPQAMAYAVIAGLAPIYGLYAGLVPLLMYLLFGSSRQLAIGPVAIDMLIVGAGVGALAQSRTEPYLVLRRRARSQTPESSSVHKAGNLRERN